MKIKIPSKIACFFSHLAIGPGDKEIGISRFDEDIILTDHPVKQHTDGTTKGKDTIIAVLLNDAGFDFVHDGKAYPFEPGTVHRFDGNKLHALVAKEKESGRFAALIWDVPVEQKTDVLIQQIRQRLKSFTPIAPGLKTCITPSPTTGAACDGVKFNNLYFDEIGLWRH
jgi:hypothetical protein